MPTKKTSSPTHITSTRHHDKRANIPTRELGDFVADEEKTPKTILYPRDPSLDPQLVWKGKDEQDQQPLAVPAVPVYIQEKISPQAIIENVRVQAQKDQPDQLNLFSDFNNISFEDLVDFYHHEQNWSNRMILGDSLLVMNSLAEKEVLKGKVQMIYMDPPYGIKFGSNWQVSTRKREVKDGKGEDLTRQPEQIKAFRDTWELGIHSYLAYLRDRLTVARDLLSDSGSIFMQIGDENVHLVRSVMDEVFGTENFISQILFRRGGFQTGQFIANTYDYILWFAKNQELIKVRPIFVEYSTQDWYSTGDRWLEDQDGLRNVYISGEPIPQSLKLHSDRSCFSATGGESSSFKVNIHGQPMGPLPGRGWSTNEKGINRLLDANRLMVKGKRPRYKPYFHDFPFQTLSNGWFDTVRGGFSSDNTDDKIYVVQTLTKVIERCLLMTTDPGDLVLDPTCGSGTTAYVAEQWGRRWITIDTSRVAIALARTRLMAGRYPYYLLSDSNEGVLKEADIHGQYPPTPLPSTQGDIKKGFVFKRVPHITLKSIANNEEIDAIHEKWQPELDTLREKISALTGKTWEEWEIPRTPALTLSQGEKEQAGKLLAEWWNLRRERQKEIDASIAKRADTELLYDQPYEDNKRVRVSGPFTVESLSPHRVLAIDEERPQSEKDGQNQATSSSFENLIIENLRKAGVGNTKKEERLRFTRLEPYAGTWLHASGEYEEKDGVIKRAAVCIGPEHGTVSPDLVKEAAKEAVLGVGFDLLVVMGFAFDPHVSEEIRRYGTLTVLPARMNPDLQMGDLLLKSGSGNLFMVFGEPDVELQPQTDGKLVVTIKGVDIYDPTTGEIRSSSTDDIACWFIDTEYNGESFFVRQAYFTGADQPYDKLKRALRAEIDEGAWSALYTTSSTAFDKPKSGKIAVKVINHYGDEVMKVYTA
ncbi:MAG: site-specific DNA-methyltransferase [Bellilinea sp.]